MVLMFKEIDNLKQAQDLLLRHFLIMNSGVYYFKNPCTHCKNFFEAGEFANEYIKTHNTKYIGKTTTQ